MYSLTKCCILFYSVDNHLSNDFLVTVKFSGVLVNSTKDSQEWLRNNLINQSVRFTLLHYESGADAVESVVHARKKVSTVLQ